MENKKRTRTLVHDVGEVTKVIDFLIFINYRGAKVRSKVITKICESLYSNMDILNDGLNYFDLNEQFKEYLRVKEFAQSKNKEIE